ncbi:hypothetical protein JTE90_003564 [Oedothorax gibbosus]|uniref:Ras-related protein Rab-7b n=1 Tax=Oedothorax gibbosus TaxID=931172 RepID=A0AAV6VKW9_9ARAC|nr:hypothetical protein JTE90_003564 [Oedothorax gibbosus]
MRKRSILKVLLLGDSAVGKTALVNRFVHKKFDSSYKATIGADFFTKDVNVCGRVTTLQIWDTVGQERFQSMGISFYRGADCVVLVYDVTSPATYHAIETWKEEFLIHGSPREPTNFPFVVIGNKIDLENRVCCLDEVQDLMMRDYTVPCFLTSAKDGTNVEEAFSMVAKLALSVDADDEYFNSFPECLEFRSGQPDIVSNKCSC